MNFSNLFEYDVGMFESLLSKTPSNCEENFLKLLEEINPTKAAGLNNLAGKFLYRRCTNFGKVTELCNLPPPYPVFPDDCKHLN